MLINALQVLLLGFTALGANSASASWTEVYNENAVKVWRRAATDTQYDELRSEIVLPVSATQAWEVVSAPQHYDKFMAYTIKTTLLERNGNSLIVHFLTDPPVISRRDVTLSYVLDVNQSQGVRLLKFREANSKGPPLAEGVVRMPLMRGHWLVQAIDSRHCRVQYQVQTNPGGLIPVWAVNAQAPGALAEVLERLRKRVLGSTAPAASQQRTPK